MLTALMFVGGLVVLTVGAEILVRGAAALAVAARISPLVVGLTVVAFGTGAPELVVSVQSALRGQADLAVGNVVGSNIFNMLCILGISALIVPLSVSQQLVRFDVPLLIALSILVAVFGYDGVLGTWDGLIFTLGLIAYTIWGIRQSRSEQDEIKQEYEAEFGLPPASGSASAALWNLSLVAVGLVLLVFGSRWFTDAAVIIARELGFSELVIGLTIVAAGTSLPEVATSVMAAYRGERDIAVGNAIGSSIFNIMGVLGISGLIAAEGVTVSPDAMEFDIPVMILAAFACLPVFFTGHLIARWEGALFLMYFCLYMTYLVLAEIGSAITEPVETFVFVFAAPLTVVTLGVGVVRSIRAAPREVGS